MLSKTKKELTHDGTMLAIQLVWLSFKNRE